MGVYLERQSILSFSPFTFVESALGELNQFAATMGFVGASYVFWKKGETYRNGVSAAPSLGIQARSISSSWQDWSRDYARNARITEPVYRICQQTVMPVFWGVDELQDRFCPSQPHFTDDDRRQFESCYKNVGIRNGVAVPIRGANGGFGYVSMFTPERITDKMWDDLGQGELILGTAYKFLSKASKYLDPVGPDDPGLSRRERECLSLAAGGHTLDEIGEELCIARSTVRYHLENSLLKLGVEKRVQAITKAVALGLLHPS